LHLCFANKVDMKVHFIAIGGAAMHNLAIALHKKGDVVTGSDDEIEEPSRSRLAANGLLPSELGWFPEKLSDEIDTVILGKHARPDNPELLEAKKLGLKICSFPEYLFQQTRDKVRVVISGSHGKTTITAMVLFVLRRMGIKTDYLIGSQIDGFSTGLSLSDENRIAIFEGDEYLTSAIDKRPKFHVYQPHIAVISGIEWDHIDAFPTFDDYVEQFRIFSKLIERDGKLIFSEKDNNIREIADNVREDVTAIPYSIPDYDIISGVTYLNNKYGSFPLKIFGAHNMQNIEAARLVCRQIGVKDQDFYESIAEFTGLPYRMEKIAFNGNSSVFCDLANTPSNVLASVDALKRQFPERKLLICLELYTGSSLSSGYLPQYTGSLEGVAEKLIYFDPDKKDVQISCDDIVSVFGKECIVFTNKEDLLDRLNSLSLKDANLLFMTSRGFVSSEIRGWARKMLLD